MLDPVSQAFADQIRGLSQKRNGYLRLEPVCGCAAFDSHKCSQPQVVFNNEVPMKYGMPTSADAPCSPIPPLIRERGHRTRCGHPETATRMRHGWKRLSGSPVKTQSKNSGMTLSTGA